MSIFCVWLSSAVLLCIMAKYLHFSLVCLKDYRVVNKPNEYTFLFYFIGLASSCAGRVLKEFGPSVVSLLKVSCTILTLAQTLRALCSRELRRLNYLIQ